MVGLTVAIILFLLLLVSVFATYNRFIGLLNLVSEAWSDIDVQLKRRADLIPNLVSVVTGYAKHEQTTLEAVARLRAGSHSQSTAERSESENALTQGIKSIFAIAEAYPDLKANEQFLSLQHTLVDVEDQIQYARRYYNGAVRNYNTLVNSFPSNLVASAFQYETKLYFELDLTSERSAPDLDMSH